MPSLQYFVDLYRPVRRVHDWIDLYWPRITDATTCTDLDIHNFEQKWQISFREDHKNFLRLLGGGKIQPKFFEIMNIDYQLYHMDSCYQEYDVFPEERPPSGWLLFALNFNYYNVAIHQRTGVLYYYEGGILCGFFSKSVDVFLAQQLYIYFNFDPIIKDKINIGYHGYRRVDNQAIRFFLIENGFKISEELCDTRKVCAQYGDVSFFSDFHASDGIDVKNRNKGLFSFSAPETNQQPTALLAQQLASLLGLEHRINAYHVSK